MTYQKPINPQRFDETVYKQLQPRKKKETTVRLPKPQDERGITSGRPGNKKSRRTKARRRAGASIRTK